MTSVTSFTRTPRGPMGPMPPSRTPVTRHLHYSAAYSPTQNNKGETGEIFIIPSYRSYRSSRTCMPPPFFFFFRSLRRRILSWKKWRPRILSSFRRSVGIGDDFIAAVSMPPGPTRGWISARGRIEEGKRERVKGDKEGRRCGALVATGAVQLPP